MDKQHKLIEKYGSAMSFYNTNTTVRESLEGDWRDAAQLTLPYVFPIENQDESAMMPTPFNSIGPSAVNALASKLLIALLPPTGAFFRLLPHQESIQEMDADAIKGLDTELSKVEQEVVENINAQALRVPVFEAIKLLIITGNAMLYKVPNGTFKVFSPYQYVVQRDYVGELLTAVVQEKMDYITLPQKVKDDLAEYDNEAMMDNNGSRVQEVKVYTMITRCSDNNYQVWQEINGMIIEGSEKKYTKDKLPYITLRWTTVNNESYGRGLVQQYLGDFRSLEGLSQTIVEGGGIAAKHIFGVRPGSTVKVEDLNNAGNGDFILGDLEKEVSTLQVNKGNDLAVPFQLMQSLEGRISKAFLMLGGQVRDSERTTATEVRAVAAELEATLGGIFSVLAAEFQTPLVTLMLHEINPTVLKITTPSITTGIGAISRERDFNNLNVMLQSMAQLGPEVLMRYMKIESYLAQVATSLGIDPYEIIKTPEQIQQEDAARQQQEQQAMAQEAALKNQPQQEGGQQ